MQGYFMPITSPCYSNYTFMNVMWQNKIFSHWIKVTTNTNTSWDFRDWNTLKCYEICWAQSCGLYSSNIPLTEFTSHFLSIRLSVDCEAQHCWPSLLAVSDQEQVDGTIKVKPLWTSSKTKDGDRNLQQGSLNLYLTPRKDSKQQLHGIN